MHIARAPLVGRLGNQSASACLWLTFGEGVVTERHTQSVSSPKTPQTVAVTEPSRRFANWLWGYEIKNKYSFRLLSSHVKHVPLVILKGRKGSLRARGNILNRDYKSDSLFRYWLVKGRGESFKPSRSTCGYRSAFCWIWNYFWSGNFFSFLHPEKSA